MAKKDYLIPFNKKGCLLNFPISYDGVEWRQNYTFKSPLLFTGLNRGIHACFKELESEITYTMFITDFEELIKASSPLRYGIWFEDWTFQKRGQNYGIRRAP